MASSLVEARKRIIVALDVDNLERAGSLVRALAQDVGYFKIGLELTTAVGVPSAVKTVHDLGGQVFLDLKLNDIPNTVGGAAKAAAGLGVAMFNVHASAGMEAIRAAVANKGQSKVLGVTVLTSLGSTECQSIFGAEPGPKAVIFAQMLLDAGADGIICSPQELELLGAYPELRRLLKVTPGIRPAGSAAGDQQRITTPIDAIRGGANYLVIGRPITAPQAGIDPVDAARRIAEEIASAL